MFVKKVIRILKTYWIFEPILASINLLLFLTDRIAAFRSSKNEKRDNKLLIIKTDVIGDYFFFRNFLEAIRNSNKYKKHHITLIGNRFWKDIFDTFDHQYVDQVIWIDIYKLSIDIPYRYSIIKEISSYKYHIAFNPVYTRMLVVDDFLMRAVNSKNKIGQKTSDYNIKKWEMWLGDKFYTELIDGGEDIFEFNRNKKVIESFLEEKIKFSTIHININKENKIEHSGLYQKPYVVMVPGAGDQSRQWHPDFFARVAEYILLKTKLNIYVSGSKAESPIAEKIINKCNSNRIHNLANNLPLPELIFLLNDSSLLISNDSSAIPMSVGLNIKTICIANGKNFGRYTPYPEGMAPNLTTFYPPDMRRVLDNKKLLQKINKVQSQFNINQISPEEVIEEVRKKLMITEL